MIQFPSVNNSDNVNVCECLHSINPQKLDLVAKMGPIA